MKAIFKQSTIILCCAMLHVGTTLAAEKVTIYYTDPQGTVLAETDINGNITATFDYAPYGAIALGQAQNGPGYTGHISDTDADLIYMQARYYDSSVGRFLSSDVIRPLPGDLSHINNYDYVENNPINKIDPFGEYICKGKADECESISTGLAEISQAAKSLPQGSTEQSALNSIVTFFGEEGSKNGVTVKFSALPNGQLANEDTDGHKTTITVDLAKSDSMPNRTDGSNNSVEFAAALAHEATHGMDGQKDKHFADTEDKERGAERRAYATQGYVNEGLGVNSAYGIWRAGMTGIDQQSVNMNAERSVKTWCLGSGQCK